jgi:hypothetical protein
MLIFENNFDASEIVAIKFSKKKKLRLQFNALAAWSSGIVFHRGDWVARSNPAKG